MTGFDVVVVGSINMDLVVRAPHLPVPGETLTGRTFVTAHGGKGANQAVAAARLGARTAMIGCVGDDAFGAPLRDALAADGIEVRGVRTVPGPSGVALITVDDGGKNGIVVVPGANGALAPADVDGHAALLDGPGALVLQLESPMATVVHAARRGRSAGRTVLLNPAPAAPLSDELLAATDVLVPNEIEAAMLTGAAVDGPEGAAEAGRRLRARGPATVIVTLGERGAVVVTADGWRHLAARPVRAVDTTAAGDTFIGGLAAALVKGRTLTDALAYAQAAAAISVTRPGAQPSIPHAREVQGG